MADSSRTVRVRFTGVATDLVRAARASKAAMDGVKRSSRDFSDRIDSAAGGLIKLGAAAPAIAGMGAALSAAAAASSALVGALGPAAVGGAVTAAGAYLAVGQAVGVAKLAFRGFADAVDGDAVALKRIGPEGASFARTIKGLRPEVDKLQRLAGKGLFPGLDAATQRVVKTFLPIVQRTFRDTGQALGSLADQGGRMVASGPWARDFGNIAATNVVAVRDLGGAGLALADAARNVVAASTPLVLRFTGWAKSAAEATAATVSAGRESGRLSAFLVRGANMAAQWGRILRDLGAGLFKVFSVGASEGGRLVDSLERGAAQFRKWTNSATGVRELAGWFADGRRNLEALGRLLKDASGAFGSLNSSANLAPFLDQLRTELLPVIVELIRNAQASGALGKLITAVADLARVLADASGNGGALAAFVSTLGALAKAAAFVSDNVPGASTALGALLVVAGTRRAAGLLGLRTALDALGGSVLKLGKSAATAGLKGAATQLKLFASGFRDANAAQSAFSGNAGTLGGFIRRIPGLIGQGAAAVGRFAASVAVAAARMAASLVVMSAQAVAAAARFVAAMVVAAAQAVAQGARMAAAVAVTAARVVAGWVVMGAQALAGAARVALAWLIAMGPIALVIAAVVGLVILIIRNWDTIKRVTAAAWDWVWGKIKAVGAGIAAVVRLYVGLVLAYWGWLARLPGMVGGWFAGAYRGAVSWLARLGAAVRALPGQVRSGLGNLGSLLLSAGGDLISGLVQGIKNKAGAVAQAAKDAASAAVGAVKGFLQINSPSKVFAKIGGGIPEGMVKGINAGSADVARAVELMTPVTGPNGTATAALAPASSPVPEVRVFLGDRELTDLVRVEVRNAQRADVGAARAGTGRR